MADNEPLEGSDESKTNASLSGAKAADYKKKEEDNTDNVITGVELIKVDKDKDNPENYVTREEYKKQQEKIMQLEGTVGSQQEKIMQLEGTVGSQQEKIMQLEGTVGSQQEKIMQLEGTVGSQQEKIMQLEGTVGSQQEKLEHLEGTVGSTRKTWRIPPIWLNSLFSSKTKPNLCIVSNTDRTSQFAQSFRDLGDYTFTDKKGSKDDVPVALVCECTQERHTNDLNKCLEEIEESDYKRTFIIYIHEVVSGQQFPNIFSTRERIKMCEDSEIYKKINTRIVDMLFMKNFEIFKCKTNTDAKEAIKSFVKSFTSMN